MLESFDPHTLGVLVLSGGLSVAMVWLAARLKMLEQREPNRCPACGVIRRHGECSCSR